MAKIKEVVMFFAAGPEAVEKSWKDLSTTEKVVAPVNVVTATAIYAPMIMFAGVMVALASPIVVPVMLFDWLRNKTAEK